LWRADALASNVAVAREPLCDLPDQRFVICLIIGSIKFELVIVHEDRRSAVVRWRAKSALLSEGR
jgi:hypothetical protein